MWLHEKYFIRVHYHYIQPSRAVSDGASRISQRASKRKKSVITSHTLSSTVINCK